MKTFNSKHTLLVATFALLAIGCGKSEQFSTTSDLNGGAGVINDPGLIPVSPDGDNGGSNGGYVGSNTVSFKPVSLAEFNSYVALHPLNAPTNINLTVDMFNAGNGRYAGDIKLSYTDNGLQYEGVFSAGEGQNQDIKGLRDNNVMEAEFNRWYIVNGKYYFSAYFQDQYGALVLVFDEYINGGDAQGSGTVSGTVYYKNFAQSYATQSPYRKCWFIYNGVFNCRSNVVNNKNQAPTSANMLADGYRKLGTFSGLDRAAAMASE